MQPRKSIDEINKALKNPPRDGDVGSLESYYRQQAENALAALIGAEAAIGAWQDVASKTKDTLDDVEQELVTERANHAITSHLLKEISEEESTTTQTWVHETAIADSPESVLATATPKMEDADFNKVVRELLLKLHKVLALRKVLNHMQFTKFHDSILRHVRDGLDLLDYTDLRTRPLLMDNGGSVSSAVKEERRQRRKEARQRRRRDAGMLIVNLAEKELNAWYESRVRSATNKTVTLSDLYQNYITGNEDELVSRPIFDLYLSVKRGITRRCNGRSVYFEGIELKPKKAKK